MICTGVVRGKWVELEDGGTLPEGTRVRVIPEETATNGQEQPTSLREWLKESRKMRAQLPKTSDSVVLLRQIREGRASR